VKSNNKIKIILGGHSMGSVLSMYVGLLMYNNSKYKSIFIDNCYIFGTGSARWIINEHRDFTNLPKILLQKSYDKLSLLTSEKLLHTENLKTIIDLLKISIENFVYNEKKMLMFTDMIKKRDNYRKISIEHYIPEVYKNI
jgi:hypothetical protein